MEAERGALKTSFLPYCCLLTLLAISGTQLPAQTLIDAPQPQSQSQSFTPAAQQMVIPPPPPARKYAEVIEPGQTATAFTPGQKIIFSFVQVARPIHLLPALLSSSYEQIFLTDPKYGSDSGAFGEKFGAAMVRSSSVRIFSDGLFAAAFHQDPHYYRVAHGSVLRRTMLSAKQAIIRRSDSGNQQFNYSGIAGRAAAAALTVAYYPEPSVTARVVGLTWATSIATDAGGNLVLEFIPSIVRKVPILSKLGLE